MEETATPAGESGADVETSTQAVTTLSPTEQFSEIAALANQENMQEYIDLAIFYGLNILYAVAILFFGRMIARVIKKMVTKAMNNAKLDTTLVSFISNIAYALISAFVFIAALNKLGIQTASLVAIIGAAGLAIGLALQGSLSNFAAGVMIILFKQFRVGDFIEAGGVSGTVDTLDIFNTVLLTANNQRIIVPNASITSGAITNYSTFDTRRIDITVGIGYEDDINKARSIITNIMEQDSRIIGDKGYTILVKEFGDNSVNLAVRCWTANGDYWNALFDLQESIKNAFDKEGVSFPFPQRDVHIYDMGQVKLAKAS